MNIFTIQEHVYQTEPVFVLNCSSKRLLAYIKRRFGHTVEDWVPTVVGTVLTFNSDPRRIVWIKDYDGSVEARAVVVHELLHLVMRILSDKGVPVVCNHPNGDNGDEAAAYLLEFFYREFHTACEGPRK